MFAVTQSNAKGKIPFDPIKQSLEDKNNRSADQLFDAYQLADCKTESIFYNAYASSVGNNSDRIKQNSSTSASMMLETCDECPEMTFASLQGIIGYPQVNSMSLCSAPDTISLLVYNAGECSVGNLVLTINFDSGLSYGGFVQEQYGKPISELNTSDLSNPQFIITPMDSADVYIINFGVKADCDVDIESTEPLNFDVTYSYTYQNTASGTETCTAVESEIGNFNNGIKVPVLNVLSVSPVTRNLTASNTPGCQNITIRQDGLGAKLSEFNFDVCGHSSEYAVAAFRLGAPTYLAIPYTTDPVTGNLTGTVDGSHIATIGNTDAVMDANEQIVVQICYQAEGCLDDPMFLEYKATYGCNGKKCGDASSVEAAVDYVPDYGANAVATTSMIEYGGICGDNIKFNVDLTSANPDPLDGVWQDIFLKFNACLGGNLSLVGINMNGTPLPAGVVSDAAGTVTLDFSQLTTDPDGAGTGLEDLDGDGIFDDLPGGNVMTFDVEIAIGCSTGSLSCSALACSISRIEVNGKRNCGQDFQQFANLATPVDFFYGEESQSNNNMMITGHSTPITEVFVTTANVWNPFIEGYTFNYEFGSENITPCPGGPGNIYAVATVTANGNRINNLRYEAGSATYQGAAVPGVTWQYNTLVVDAMGTLDTTSISINIPAGDSANDPSHEYYFNLEAFGFCAPNDYMDVTLQIIEECASCGDPEPCKIVRSCNAASTFVDWNGTMCPCFIRGFVETQERTNYGYTDKTMTTKVDTSTIPEIDKRRYLPGDTMFVRQGFEILDATQVLKGDGFWQFVFNTDSETAAPVIPDHKHGMFKGWFLKKASTGVITEIGIPTCFQDPKYDDENQLIGQAYPGMYLYNFGVDGRCSNANPLTGTCPNDPSINPNYPPGGIVDYAETPLSVAIPHNDRPGFYIYWGQDDECASANDVSKNDCYESFLEEFPIEDGDVIYIDYETPMMHNPNYDLQQLNGTSYSAQGNFYNYMNTRAHNAACGIDIMASSCNTGTQYFGHIPGPVEVSTNVTVTDCDIQVSYDFLLLNPLPDPGAGEPWYQNEIRNAVAVEYLEPQFPSNMVYLGDGSIRMPDGTVMPIPSANIDDTQGNLACDPTGTCCVAADGSELMGLRINDDDYNVLKEIPYAAGPDGPYESGNSCDDYNYWHKPNDPFPMFAVGGSDECTWGMDFSLSALCPETVESSDFRLCYQFADRYVTDLHGIAPGGPCANNVGMHVSTNSYPATAAGTPYAGAHSTLFPINPYAQGDGTTLTFSYQYYPFQNITTHPDASPGSINPMRQTGCAITSPDNFTDNSLDYPPLMATLSNLLIGDEAGVSEMNMYEVCAGSVAGGATHMNVVTSITLDNSVDFLGATDAVGTALPWTLSSSTANTTTYALSLPDLAPGDCTTIMIETELLFCPIGLDITTDVCVSTVSGCLPPDKAAALAGLGEGCNSASNCYKYLAQEAGLQAEWLPYDLPEFPLCSTFELETVIKNVKEANLVDIKTMWWFPAGLNYVPGTWEVCYQGGPNVTGPCVTIPDPTADASQNSVYGTYFDYLDDQIWSSQLAGDPINSNGLPGFRSSLDSNFVKFRFEVETVCDEFISGTNPWFLADAADPCEQRTQSMFVGSPPIIVEGANPADFSRFLVFADPVEAVCGTESTLTLTYLNTSQTGTTENSMVCMDIETSTFDYMMGSVSLISPAGYTPTFTETQNGSITHICFDIPDGIGPGQVFQTGFTFTVPEDISCGEQDLGIQVSSELMSRDCMAQGIECSVGVLNSVNPVINIEFLPPVTVQNQDLRIGCSTADGKVEACYDVELVNNGTTYSNDIDIVLIYDVDQNGQIDDYDVKLDSSMHSVLITSGDTIMISGCLEVDADKACPIFLMVMQETNCVCDAQDFYYPSLEPDLGLDGQTTFGVCPGEPFGMEYCGDFTYTLDPSTGGTITTTADSLFVDLNSGTSEVILNVTGSVGQCEPFDYDLTIKSLMDFELGPFSTIEVCSDACKVLNAGIPIEYQSDVTVEWVPSTHLDDPTSFTPTACNIDEDITYTIIATFTSGDATCVFNADLPIIVQEPVTNDIFEGPFYLCETDITPIEAPAGKDNYFWYEVNPAGDDPIVGVGAAFSPEEPGMYYLECSTAGDVCTTSSNIFEVSPCVDLALIKTVNPTTPGPYANGSTITYDVTVFNQSATVDVFNVYIKDYFPECLVLTDPAWLLNTPATAGANGEAVIVSPIALIPANGQQTRTITFTISPTCASTPIINNGEISGYDDDNDPMTPPAPDEDSTPDDDSATPPETGTNDNYDDDNPNMPGAADDPADSDDYDPEEIELTPCPTIGGEVFVDLNNNGCQDATDVDMVEGVEVTIWACDPATGAPVSSVGSVTTGSDGQWSFGGSAADGSCILDPEAQYTATFDIPNQAGDLPGDPYVGYEFSTGTAPATCADGESDDVDPATGQAESCFDPDDDDAGDGDADENIDAGISPPCETIGGEVFVDTNDNGCQDAGETIMVEGAVATIWECDPATGEPLTNMGTDTTDVDGQWSFGGVDPVTGECVLDHTQSYTVVFEIPNGAGEAYEAYEFSEGVATGACLEGEADDVNPATGQSEQCYDPGDEDPGDGDDDNDIDAGITPPCQSIGGEVFVDANNNGCQDAAETTMVEGAVATIWVCDPITGSPTSAVGTATTGADGSWTFGGPDPVSGECLLDDDATYTVTFDIPNTAGDLAGDPYVGYELSTGAADATCVDGEADDVDPATGQAEDCYDPNDDDGDDGDDDENIDAGISPCETIGGEVYVDANNNGCQDAAETTMVEGAEVTIYTCDPITGDPSVVVGTATTGADGSWSFGGADPATGECLLAAGQDYTVSFDIPNAAGDLAGDPFVGYGFSTGVADATCVDGEADDVHPGTGIAEDCYDPDDEDGEDGDDDEDIDAGISPCEMMGGEVFVDANNNGCQDADETIMVEGVEVTIFACDPITGEPSTAIGTATTGADGAWSFGGADPATGECLLDAGSNYTVSFDLPNAAGDIAGDPYVGYEFSTGEADVCADGETDDVDPDTGIAEDCYDPDNEDGEDGDDDEDIDAGISPCETMGGEVFVDANNNGCQDADETIMVEGVDVTIFACDPITGDPSVIVGTATTGADGAWSFGGADPETGDCLLDAGSNYTVSFDLPNEAGDITGDPYVGFEFSTGVADATCADGESDDVDPDTGIAEDCYDPSDEDGEDGDDDEDIDVGISPCETMGGEVFVDENNNGCQDSDETIMVEGVEVTIQVCDPITGDPSTIIGTTTTDADGAWSFGGSDPATGDCLLAAGSNYTVSFDLPNAAGDITGDPYVGYEFSTGVADATCADGAPDDVDPDTGVAEECYDPSDEDGEDGNDDEDIDAGISPCETMGGEVFVDENNNGCQDADETTMVEGVEVTIWTCDPISGEPSVVVGTATTGADGVWSFGGADPETGECLLAAGENYTVSFDLPNATGDVAGDPYVGYEFSTGVADATCADGAPDDVDPGTGIAEDCYDPDNEDGDDGDDDEDIDVGISPCETMGGEVFVDANNNGCQDADETTMVEGVEVTIWTCDPITGDPSAIVGTATTGADGAWSFGGADPETGECLLAAGENYTVSFDLPNAAGDVAGDPYVGFDFSTESADASCADGDPDDVDEDTGIAEDCYDPDDEDGDDGDDDEDIDAGISPCESIGGEVFVDTNNNGCQEADETLPVPGVEVTVWACDPITGDPVMSVGTATTGPDGTWSLSGANPETGDCLLDPDLTYSATFDLPDGPGEAFEGYVFSMAEDAMCADTADADDVDPTTGESECYDPSDDGDDDDGDEDIDAGIYPCQSLGGTVFYDDNINGCQDNAETAVMDPIGVSLFECGQDPEIDIPVASTSTINGDYEFGLDSPNENAQVCLDENKSYFVVFDIPDTPGEDLEGYVFTDGTDTCAAPEDADDVDPLTGESECYGPGDDDGGEDDDIDAGIFKCQNLEGVVFYDLDNNGCQEGSESVVTIEVSVTLYECGQTPGVDEPVASTMTMDGEYEFGQESMNEGADVCLQATKTYFVVFDLPNDSPSDPLYGFEWTTNTGDCASTNLEDDVDPSNGNTPCYNPDDEDGDDGDEHVDGGIYPCQELGGEVFFDISNNGCQETGEDPILESVTVELYLCGQDPSVDTPVASTSTVDGEYMFGEEADDPNAQICLEPGTTYFVHFDVPNGAGEALQGYGLSTNDNFCVGEGTSDDVDPITGDSECYDPDENDDEDGDEDDHIDAGLFECEDVGGTVFYDMNNNGCQDAGETAVSEEITVTLFECSAGVPGGGTPVATTTTIDGEYEFGAFSPNPGGMVCLEPAKEYYVVFDIPNGAGETLEHWNLSSHADECADPADSDNVDPATGQSECFDPEDAGDDGDDDGDNEDGDDDNHIDAGIYPCEEVSGEVFLDYNGDGCKDGEDVAVTDPVNVSIYMCGDDPATTDPVASTTTANGEYEFGVESENPGADVCLDPYFDYTIVFDIPNGAGEAFDDMDFSEGEEVCADPADSDDVDPETGQSECYDAGDDDGDGDEDIDAGIDPCAEIAGDIFYDDNNNGCQDDGEELVLEEIGVSVYSCNQTPGVDDPIGSTTTTDGHYEFGVESDDPDADICLDPALDYFVVFDLPNGDGEALDNYVFSSESETCANPDDADNVDPLTGQTDCTDPDDDGSDDMDGGIYECQDLSGEIFLDVNNNGCQDNGEGLVLEDVTVEIFECDDQGNPSGPSISSITTNDGEYEFGPDSEDVGGNVCLDPSKTYYVQFSFDDSEGAPLQGHNFSGDGACAAEVDADDINPDTGESGCYNPNDDDGDDGDDDNHVDAGINPCQEISGDVFFDIAGDGCEDGNDTNVTVPITVTLYECSGGANTGGTPVASTTTIDGSYMFGEESPNPDAQVCLQSDKQYYVVFDIPNSPGEALDNYVFTNGTSTCAGAGDSDDVDDLDGRSDCLYPDDSDGDDDDHIDAGLMELASLGNYVWHDEDGDGIQDTDEDGLENIVVRLYDGDGNLVSVTSTDSDGFYLFDKLYPGDYYVEFGPPSQYPLTTDPNQGGDSDFDSDIDGSNGPNTTQITNLSPGENDMSWDAGFYKCVPIGELVWYDVDMDNIWDDNENGINGLEVTLFRKVNGNWKKWDRAFTGHKPGTPSDDGYYKFCAPPGEYYLHIDLPPYGLVPVRSDMGNDELRDSDFDHGNGPGTTSSFTVRSGDEKCDIGAGYYPMATVGDIVWMDDNADGVRQPTEAFAAGVVVEAYDIYNDMVGSDVTDANGSYMIDYLQQEGYYLRVQPPSGYTVTNPNMGSDESMDSDIDHSNGNYTTQYYMMDPGVHMPNVDAGLVAGVALPVELISFTGQYRPDYIYLSWATAAEINTEYFQIERRHESEEEFVSIGRQLTKGSDSKYTMNDYDVERDGAYYYRLRSIDTDGSEQLSEVISVQISRDRENGVSIYPNPAVSDVNIELSLNAPKQVKIDIYDTQGKLIRGNVLEGRLEKGTVNKAIDVNDIPAGVYNVQIQLGDEVLTRRLILLKN